MNLQVGNLVKYISVDSKNQNHIGVGVITFAGKKEFSVSWLCVNDPHNSKPEDWRADFLFDEFEIGHMIMVLS